MGVKCKEGIDCVFVHQGVLKGQVEKAAWRGEQSLKKVVQKAKRPAENEGLEQTEAKAQRIGKDKDVEGFEKQGERKPRTPRSDSQESGGSVSSNTSFLNLTQDPPWPMAQVPGQEGSPEAQRRSLTNTLSEGTQGKFYGGRGGQSRGQGTVRRGGTARRGGSS